MDPYDPHTKLQEIKTKYLSGKSGWKPCHEVYEIDIGVDGYFKNIWSN